MAQIYPLKLVRSDDVILIEFLINTHKASLLLHTGATNTIVDLNTLLIGGYSFASAGQNKFETANGITEVDKIQIKSCQIWNRIFNEVQIFTLDFVEEGITSHYEGVLGLDFMKQFA